MTEENTSVTVGDAAVRSIEAMESAGASVKKGVESLTKDVKKAADAALTAATGAAQYAYPQLVRKRKMIGASGLLMAGLIAAMSLAMMGVVVALLVYGVSVDGDDPLGCVRFAAVIVCGIAAFVLSVVSITDVGSSGYNREPSAWVSYYAPEGKVIEDLLDRFTE